MSDYNEWPPRLCHSPLISSRWQNELNRIGGFSPTGLPILRLEWGGSTTWTPSVKELKYLHRRDNRQTGWGVHVYNPANEIINTLTFGLKAKNIPEPSSIYGIAFPLMEKIEIGIPRFWISQWIPPALIGPWSDVRRRLLDRVGSHADIGSEPHRGFYYLGFHLLAHHEGHACCEKAKIERRKCFGYYREPSDLDMLYVSSLIKAHNEEPVIKDWTETADERVMYKALKNLNNRQEDKDRKDREEMKLRIRDAFKSHRGKLTSRKGQDRFIFSSQDIIMPGTSFQ